MRILWLTPSLPCPTTGNRVRQYHLLKQLSCQHKFTVLSFLFDFEAHYVDLLRSCCMEVVTLPLHSPLPLRRWRNRFRSWSRLLLDPLPAHLHTYPMHRLRSELDRLLTQNAFDLIHIETLHPARLLDSCQARRALLAEQNIESTIQHQRLAQARRPLQAFREWSEWRKLLRYETAQLHRFPAIITVSQADAAQCRALAPITPIHVVPNGVDVSWFTPPPGHDPTKRCGLLFVGTMDYTPNVDAVLHFCRDIWPRVSRLVPEITLTIAGAHPTPEVLTLNEQAGVKVTGYVEDIRPYFWNAAICVVPLRIGGGTRVKILESMAARLPVISTTIGAEGLDVVNGKDLLLADTPSDFAQAVDNIINDHNLAQSLSQNGRCLVEEKYEWQAIAQKLDQAYQELF